MKKLITIIIALGGFDLLMGQEIPIGTWRSHFNFDEAILVEEAGSRIYCATELALFSYDKEDNSLAPLSKVNGLSDVGISAMAYSTEADRVIIGYANGNLDIFDDNEVINLRSILEAQVLGSREINHITVDGSIAYLSTDFGVIVIDLGLAEVRESYRNLGPMGEVSAVRESALLGDSLYLATDFGVIAGNVNANVNLRDFQNWNRYNTDLPVATDEMHFVTVMNQEIVAGAREGGLFRLRDFTWSSFLINGEAIVELSPSTNGLLIVFGNRIVSVNENGEMEEINYRDNAYPHDVLVDTEGRIWIADGRAGLFGEIPGGFDNFSLSGPASNQTFKLFHDIDRMIALPGGIDGDQQPIDGFSGYSVFQNGSWEVIATIAFNFGNLTDIDRRLDENLFIASFGDGFLEVETSNRIDAGNAGSPLLATPLGTLITGIDFDSNSNLWLSNYNNPQAFHRRDVSGTWTSFNFSASSSRFPLSLEVNQFDDIWSRIDPEQGGGILVFNVTTDQERLLQMGEGLGNLPHPNVTDIVFDREGQAWVGTEEGVAFYANPFNIFEEEGFDAVQPIFENRPLLENEFITAIAVDGGNRKWIGTFNGLWLFSDGGERLVSNFNVDNSPLPGNTIIDVEIDPNSGEVFISTDMGMVSFRGTSTEGAETHQTVKIFPNPVRPGFTGTVGISGLVTDANVKITDVGGRLVREVNAEGGTATWDTRDFQGNEAVSGVYFVFSASQDGDETFIGKIAIVR